MADSLFHFFSSVMLPQSKFNERDYIRVSLVLVTNHLTSKKEHLSCPSVKILTYCLCAVPVVGMVTVYLALLRLCVLMIGDYNQSTQYTVQINLTLRARDRARRKESQIDLKQFNVKLRSDIQRPFVLTVQCEKFPLLHLICVLCTRYSLTHRFFSLLSPNDASLHFS